MLPASWLQRVLKGAGLPSLALLCFWGAFTPQGLAADESPGPSKDYLYLQYGQVASQVRNAAMQFATREVARSSPIAAPDVRVTCCELFMFGDEFQLRWQSGGDRANWQAGCKFHGIGGTPVSGTKDVDRVFCFRSEGMQTAEFLTVRADKKAPYDTLIAVYESERILGPFFMPYVAAERQWNYRDEFVSAGRPLVDECFQHSMDHWSDPQRTTFEGEERWRVDVSLSGQRVPLPVKPDHGKLEGEDILTAWFALEPPYHLRTITRERRFFHNGAAVPTKFTGSPWWERRVDLSDYNSLPNGFTFPAAGRETMSIALKPINTFDEVAASYLKDGALILGSSHYTPVDRSWSVGRVEKLESAAGLWIDSKPGMLTHNVDKGTELIHGKTIEETAAILGYDLSANKEGLTPQIASGRSRTILITINIVVIGGLVWWMIRRRHSVEH
jgi:hypothetical protein